VLAFAVALVIVIPLRARSTVEVVTAATLIVPLLLAVAMVTGVGLLDDVRGVSPSVKLAVQTVASLLLYACGFRIEVVSNPLGGSIDVGALSIPLTVLWLVGMSNAFNLVDGLDGLAAGLGFVSTLGLLVAAAANGHSETTVVAAALAGALLGFLPYNFSPARIFLGDCGALTVGFVLAAVAVRGSMKTSAAIAVAVPLLALALPILDVALAVVRRFVRRRPVFRADKDHIHHRLVALGLTPRRAVMTLYGVAAVFTALAMAVAMGPRQVAWTAALLALLVLVWVIRVLGYWEVTEFQRSFLSRLASGVRLSGDGALRGLEEDLKRTDHLDRAWTRLCEASWSLGFEELHVLPRRGTAAACPKWHAFAPRPSEPEGRAFWDKVTWSFYVQVGGEPVAKVVARRRLGRTDFDPHRFTTVVERLVIQGMAGPGPAGRESPVESAVPVSSPAFSSFGPA
jgi:UDP-GlcNAc:undecaprenyl-phosphate GlcNAc-1-phosphate transferase